MKTKYALILLLIFSAVSCSKTEIDEDEPPTVTRCFTVKELGSEINIENARVILKTFVCIAGCGEVMLGNEVTDSNGKVCFILSNSDNESILQISCTASGYNQFEINSPELGFSEIYLEPILN